MEDDAGYPLRSYPSRRQNPSNRQNTQFEVSNILAHRFFGTRIPRTTKKNEEPEEFDDYNDDEVENGYVRNFEEIEGFATRKKRKLRGGSGGGGSSTVSNYDLSPRAKFSYGNRRGSFGSEEWSEHVTFVLLEVWGDKFPQLGRNNLRSEEWHKVAEKVSEELNRDGSNHWLLTSRDSDVVGTLCMDYRIKAGLKEKASKN